METKNSKSMRDDMRLLAVAQKPLVPLPAVPKKGATAAARGVAVWDILKRAATAGIASPLTEPLQSAREYHAEGTRSSDGLFFIPAIKKLVMRDANDAEVIFQYAAQAEEEP